MRLFLISFVLVLSFTGVAFGDPQAAPSAAAAPYLERGLQFYTAHQYAEAIAELRKGYEVEQHPDFLYAIGQAQRMSGDCRAAIESYRAYLRMQPPELEASRAKSQIERCAAQAPAPPTEMPLAAAPARAEFGTVGIAMASGSVIGFGAGTLFLILGGRHATAANRPQTPALREAEETAARNYRILGGVAIVGGAALGTLAVMRYLRRDTRDGKPAVTASVGADHVYVGAELSF